MKKSKLKSKLVPYKQLQQTGKLGNPNFTNFKLCDCCGGDDCSGGGSDLTIVS